MRLSIAPPMPTEEEINAERDRRLLVGFSFQENVYQADERSIGRINGAVTAATIAIARGAEEGDFFWADPTGQQEHRWITADNKRVPMDAQTTIPFGFTAMSFVARMTDRARNLKDQLLNGVRPDYKSDASWQ